MLPEFDPILDEMSGVLLASTPKPNAARRARVIALACENFDTVYQETGNAGRQTDQKARKITDAMNRGFGSMREKLKWMLAGGAIAAVVAGGVVAINVATRNGEVQSLIEIASLSVDEPEVLISESKSGSISRVVPDLAIMNTDSGRARMEPLMDSAGEISLAYNDGSAGHSSTSARGQLTDIEMMLMQDHMILPALSEVVRFVGDDVNPVRRVADEPVSTFSIDVDTASWSFLRARIQSGQVPSPEMVRIEEMINYFDYDYSAPDADSDTPFATHVSVFDAPWNADRQLVRIGIQGVKPEFVNRPPLDLVFLVDTSGSMQGEDKLGLLKQSLKLVLPELGEDDRIGMVTYAGSAGVALELTDASSDTMIVRAIETLESGGSTAGAEGLQAAYDMIADAREDGRIGRVVLATDGDFNVGLSSDEELKSFIAKRRDEGAYLSVLGFGRDHYNDGMMQVLAQNGNGQAAFIDTLSEAHKVLVDQLSGALYPIANDVKIQVEFNPVQVEEYRLLGYETRALAREDFNNDKVDAGEIGVGHQVTAFYEITSVGSDAATIAPLRYGGVADAGQDEGTVLPSDEGVASDTGDFDSDRVFVDHEIGYASLRYKHPGETESILVGVPILQSNVAPDADARFAAAIAGFGELMKNDKYLGDWGYADAVALATGSRGEDVYGWRAEAVNLMRLMESLSR